MISVIIPVYNVRDYLTPCLESVAAQTYRDLEVLLVDDCSTDGSLSVLESFVARYDGPIRFRILRHEKNRGLSAARNTGLDAMTGDYVGFIDSDDYVRPEMYERLLGALQSSGGAGIVSCRFDTDTDGVLAPVVDENQALGLIPSERFLGDSLTRRLSNDVWNKLYRRDVIGDVRFREGKIHEVFLFAMDLSASVERLHAGTLSIPDSLYVYRRRSGSICLSREHCFFIDYLDNLAYAMARIGPSQADLVAILRADYLSRLLSLLMILSNPDHPEHGRYFSFAEQLERFPDPWAAKALPAERYSIFLFIKYFPAEYSRALGSQNQVV